MSGIRPNESPLSQNKRVLRTGILALAALLASACSDSPAPDAADSAQSPEPAATTPPAAAATPPAAAPSTDATDAVELEYWRTIKDSEHTEDFWSYLEKYPNGSFADLAKSRIERLSAGKTTESSTSSNQSNSPPPKARSGDLRSQRKDIVRNAIRRELKGYSDPRLHLAPNIPRFKLDNVASLHGLDPRRVLLLYDDGSGGGGKTGFCLTDRRVYWRLIAGSDPYFIDYEDISQVRVGRSGFTINGYDVPTTLASSSSLAAERFGDMIESISREMQRR